MTNSANPEPKPNSKEVVRDLVILETVEANAVDDDRSPKVTDRGDQVAVPVVTKAEPRGVVRDLVVPDAAVEEDEDGDRSPKKVDQG